MNNSLVSNLKQLNLLDSEIAVYLYLLENGSSTAAQISRKTSILRTNCYSILEKLRSKGLIEESKGARNNTFTPNNPTSILRMIEDKKEMATSALIPELTNLFKSQKNKPVIKFYDGKEQVKEIFIQMYDAEEILGFTSLKRLFEVFPNFFDKWQKEIKKRGIFLKDILSRDSYKETSAIADKALGPYVEQRFLSEKHETLTTDILIWNNNVALITIEEPIFGTVIHNKFIADTMRIQFDLIWKTLRAKEK